MALGNIPFLQTEQENEGTSLYYSLPFEASVVVVGAEVGAAVVTVPSSHMLDSSPLAAKANLFSVMSLALSERSATPRDVCVTS